MNILGHLFFSNHNLELMHANLFGDFMKGTHFERFSVDIQNGIKLHREIDNFMDTHPAVRATSAVLSIDLPKVAGIALDLYFDHFLVKHWSTYDDVELSTFLNAFYHSSVVKDDFPSAEFHRMLYYLKGEKWISSYGDLAGIEQACKGVSRRISFPNALVNGRMVLEKHYQLIEKTFFVYMQDAIVHFNKYKAEHGIIE